MRIRIGCVSRVLEEPRVVGGGGPDSISAGYVYSFRYKKDGVSDTMVLTSNDFEDKKVYRRRI